MIFFDIDIFLQCRTYLHVSLRLQKQTWRFQPCFFTYLLHNLDTRFKASKSTCMFPKRNWIACKFGVVEANRLVVQVMTMIFLQFGTYLWVSFKFRKGLCELNPKVLVPPIGNLLARQCNKFQIVETKLSQQWKHMFVSRIWNLLACKVRTCGN